MKLGPGCAAAVLLFLVAGCSTKIAEPTGCTAHADCGAGSLCIDATCAASRPPTAKVSSPTGPLLSNLRIRFEGSSSDDPDPGDRIASYAWRARAAAAPCEPVHTSGTEVAFELLTACAGRFEVGLTVRDSVGLESVERVVPVDLGASSSPPSVALPAGPIQLEHRCGGAPLRCTAIDGAGAETFPLLATAASAAPGPLAWRWSAQPPAGLATPPSLTFSPTDGSSPSVAIATDGTPIAGSYLVTVEVTDSLGVVATAQVEVVVGNLPPEAQVTGAPLSVPHLFHPSPPRYLAEGSVGDVSVVDPDGDPVTTRFAVEETGVTAPTMTLTPMGPAAVFQIVVPGGSPGQLIGSGIGRTVRFLAEDGNGGAAQVSWPVTVENRPPRRAGPFSTVSPHLFDPASGQYRATPVLADYVDDDGDPLSVSAATGDTTCATLALAGGQLRAECAVPFAGTPAVGAIAGLHAFLVTLSDPWSSLAPESTSVTIGNGGPALSSPDVSARCARKGCCEFDMELGVCLVPKWLCPALSGTAPVAASDPDGDPLAVTVDGAVTATCGGGGSCEVGVPYSLAESTLCSVPAPTSSLQVGASDGLASASLAIPLWR